MKLSNNDLLLLSHSAITAAYQAGMIISNYAKEKILVQSKIGGDTLASQVVTEVDLLSQEVILNTLAPTCKIFNLALLTEESEDDQSRLEKEYFWSIDPLDGTLPFTEQQSGYSVSISLVSRLGKPLIGVVYDPLSQTLYHAIDKLGIFRNGKPWKKHTLKQDSGKPLTLICDRSFLQQKNYDIIIEKLNQWALNNNLTEVKIVSHGGAAMNACWVLENSPACYFKFPKSQEGGGSLWDYSATATLFAEIGYPVSDIYGNPLDLNREVWGRPRWGRDLSSRDQ